MSIPPTQRGDAGMRFEFATAARVIFGPGTVREVASLAATMGTRALVVTGRDQDRAAPLLSSLNAQKIAHVPFPVAGEPTVDLIRTGLSQARAAGCHLVIAFGGGSVI